jgi:hypothetical protein
MSATLAAAAPFITQLLKTGLDRAGSILFKKFMRLRGLDKTLRVGTFTNSALETAIRDFETILGSYRGEFTIPLAELLSELTKSGIATAMAEQALLQQEREATKARFIELYTIMVESNYDKALDLYKTLKLALASSLSALFGNDAQAFAVSTFGKMLSDKLDLLQGAHGAHRWGEGLSPEDTKALLVRLTRALQGTYRSIRIETNKGPKVVNITDIYTPARLTHRPPDIIDINTLIPDENRKEVTASLRALQNVSFSEFRDTFSRALVLGDPEGGKSTLCQYICFEMAKQSLLSLQTDDPRISLPVQKIPLRITLRLYEKARIAEPQLNLFEYCSRDKTYSCASGDSNML